MRTAAQLDRPAHRVAAALPHGDDPDLVAVFLAEQSARAGSDGVVAAEKARNDRCILQHEIVGDIFDALYFLAAHGFGVRKIEAQAVGRDQRALLRYVIAEDLPQGFVEKMRRGMILADRAAPRVVDLKRERG